LAGGGHWWSTTSGTRRAAVYGPSVPPAASTREEHPEGVAVYNFQVEEDHDYFVAEDNQSEALLTHNDCSTNIRKAYNSMNDHLTPSDLSGYRATLFWTKSGKEIQHQKEVNEAIVSVRRAIGSIKSELGNPSLSTGRRQELINHLRYFSKGLDVVEGRLGF
jgi:hypothetical protein